MERNVERIMRAGRGGGSTADAEGGSGVRGTADAPADPKLGAWSNPTPDANLRDPWRNKRWCPDGVSAAEFSRVVGVPVQQLEEYNIGGFKAGCWLQVMPPPYHRDAKTTPTATATEPEQRRHGAARPPASSEDAMVTRILRAGR